jgi:hypothetical protein
VHRLIPVEEMWTSGDALALIVGIHWAIATSTKTRLSVKTTLPKILGTAVHRPRENRQVRNQ